MYKYEYNVDAAIFLEQTKDLLYMHWEELALNKTKIYLNPDVEKYVALQQTNCMFNIVVYKDDVVVGYSVIFLTPHMHYQDHKYANVDVMYVHPEYRQSTIGARLLVATEQLAKDNGASVILHHAKPYVPMIIKPLEKLNYQLYELMYGKYIGE
jgi:GNAT superfamily N-acetyltransferase